MHLASEVARFFLDTEFIEDGKTIDLVSIGICAEGDEEELEMVSSEHDPTKADEWVKGNVLIHLGSPKSWFSRKEIASRVYQYVMDIARGRPVEFWAYYADYDWVALAQLYGRMLDLPPGFPMYCMDLKMLHVLLGSPPLPSRLDGTEHQALADARWDREIFRYLKGLTVIGEGVKILPDPLYSQNAAQQRFAAGYLKSLECIAQAATKVVRSQYLQSDAAELGRDEQRLRRALRKHSDR